MRGKRGNILNEMFFSIFQLVILAFILIGLKVWVDNVVSDETFERNFMARDVALLIDTVYTAPGNVEVDYPQNTRHLNFTFEPNLVRITHPDETASVPPAVYPFAEDLAVPFAYSSVAPERLTNDELGPSVKLMASKINNRVAVSDKPVSLTSRASKLVCLQASTRDPNWHSKEVYYDPGHGEGSGINREAQFARLVGLELQNEIPGIRSTKGSFITQADTPLERRLDAIKHAALVVSVHQNDGGENTNVILAYIPPLSLESQKLGCLILNSILDELPDEFSRADLIPADDIPPDDPMQIIDTGIPSVLLEIGNANRDTLPDAAAVAAGIGRGVSAYFGVTAR